MKKCFLTLSTAIVMAGMVNAQTPPPERPLPQDVSEYPVNTEAESKINDLTRRLEALEKREKGNPNSLVGKILRDDDLLRILIDTRTDFQTTINDDNTTESRFKAASLRLTFAGEITPKIRYLVRQRLNKTSEAGNDNFGQSTDYAYFQFDLGERWTLTAGRQGLQLGTFEFNYNGADVYLASMVNDDVNAYQTGLNAAYKAGKHVFNLQVVNSDSPEYAIAKYKNKAFAGLFLWEGNFFDGGFKTRYGYAAYQHDGSKYYQWLTIGNQINIKKFMAELDWFHGDRDMDYTYVVSEANGRSHVRDNSISLNFAYDLGKFKPALKGVWSERKDQVVDGSYNQLGAQALMEYYPFTDPLLKNLRFHLAYIYKRTNFNGIYNNTEGKDQHQIIAGMRWLLRVK